MFVTNRLSEHTTMHGHGQRLPRGMMGFWVTHPKARHPLIDEVQRDFCFLLNAYDVEPGCSTPTLNAMLDFALWTWNSRAFPVIESLNIRLGDTVRIRVGDLTMSNHPIHLHGHEFGVSGTDGGPWPLAARCPEVTTDVAVVQMRQLKFVADEEGDWAFHCHKSHHTMNPMEMPLPDNTLPMMTRALPETPGDVPPAARANPGKSSATITHPSSELRVRKPDVTQRNH